MVKENTNTNFEELIYLKKRINLIAKIVLIGLILMASLIIIKIVYDNHTYFKHCEHTYSNLKLPTFNDNTLLVQNGYIQCCGLILNKNHTYNINCQIVKKK